MTVTLRSAAPADGRYCFALHQAAPGEHIAAIWGWDEDAQRACHTDVFAPGR